MAQYGSIIAILIENCHIAEPCTVKFQLSKQEGTESSSDNLFEYLNVSFYLLQACVVGFKTSDNQPIQFYTQFHGWEQDCEWPQAAS